MILSSCPTCAKEVRSMDCRPRTYCSNSCANVAKGARLFTPEEDARIIALVKAGRSYSEVGKALGRSKGSISGATFRLKAAGHDLTVPPENVQPRVRTVKAKPVSEHKPIPASIVHPQTRCMVVGYRQAVAWARDEGGMKGYPDIHNINQRRKSMGRAPYQLVPSRVGMY